MKRSTSIAVGGKAFVERLKSALIGSVSGRKVRQSGEAYELREPAIPYGTNLGAKKDDIEPQNTYFWNITINNNKLAWPNPRPERV